MFPFKRLATVATAVVLIGGSGFAGVAVAQRNAAKDRQETLEERIAALEALRSDLAGSKARIDGLGNELNGIRQAIAVDGHTVKVTGEAYLPTNLDALVVTFSVQPLRRGAGTTLRDAAELADRVATAVRRAGVSSRDVRIIYDSASVYYQTTDRFIAYVRVLATVRSLARVNSVAKAGTAVGKDVRIDSVRVSDESDTAALAEAREEALSEARAKALRYAQAAGRKLGALASIAEQVAPESAPAEPGGDGYVYRPAFIVIIDAVYALV
jgi:uncharacterized protein